MPFVIQTNYGRYMTHDDAIGWHTTSLAKATRFDTHVAAADALAKLPFRGEGTNEPAFAILDENVLDGDRGFYHAVWTTLVHFAGAVDREYDRETFVSSFTKPSTTEYRFCGHLGFGGKFWRNAGRFYVTCYPEDENRSRRQTIEFVNKLIEINVAMCSPSP